MCMIKIDGQSPLELSFLASKFNGAMKHHKKTVVAKQFDGRRAKQYKAGRKRAALESQIIQDLENQMDDWSIEMSLIEGDQKLLEAELAGAYDEDQHGDWMDERCSWCGGFDCDSPCKESIIDSSEFLYSLYGDSEVDEGCPYCGRFHCQCDLDVSDADHYSYGDVSSFDVCAYRRDPMPMHMTDEEKMKLSDALWLDHEFSFGRNNLCTLSRYDIMGGDYDFDSVEYDHYYDHFDDHFNEEPVNEFGGLPNHFDPSFDYLTHYWEGEMNEWDFSVDFTEFTPRVDPLKARRASRFSEITGGKVKRADRYGRTHCHHSLNPRWDDKEIERNKDKTAAKRAYKRLLDETFATEPKQGQKLRFKSMEEKQQYLKSLRATAYDTMQNDNVDYSLEGRRMVIRQVQVTRFATVNGRRRIISDGIELMQCRR